jgi:hypothetical protein
MTPKSLFNIILKVFGLFFLKDIVQAIPQLVSSFLYYTNEDIVGDATVVILINLSVFAFYALVVYQLLLNTNAILNKLGLDKGFHQEEFTFNISSSIVFTIALIVVGGVILSIEIPNICSHLFLYMQQRLTRGTTKPDLSYAIASAFKILVGLLLIGERKRIVNFIERRQQKHADI